MALRKVRDDTLRGTFGEPTNVLSKKLDSITASLSRVLVAARGLRLP